jgi:hypothetical protein
MVAEDKGEAGDTKGDERSDIPFIGPYVRWM